MGVIDLGNEKSTDVVDLIMIDRRSPELEKHTSARVKFLVQNYYESHLHQRAIQESSSDVSHAEPVPLEPRFPSSSDESNEMSAVVQSERFSSPMYLNVTPSLRAQRAPFIRAISLLVHRLWKGVLRDFVALSQRVVALVFFGFLIFLFIYRLPNDQTGSLRNRKRWTRRIFFDSMSFFILFTMCYISIAHFFVAA